MSYSNVKNFFDKNGIGDRIVVHKQASDTVEHAAEAIGCKPAQITKTMSFIVNDSPIVIGMTGDVKVSNSKYKSYFHQKAKMVPWDDVEEIVGHEPGGVCPFAVNDNVKVYLDVSLKRFDYIYAAAGQHDATIGMSISELEKYSNFIEWIDVCQER